MSVAGSPSPAGNPTDPDTTLLRSMRRIAQAIDVRSREIARLTGLTLPQLMVLEAVRSLGQVTTQELSREAAMSASTVVAVLDRLLAKGLVDRDRSLIDRRVVHTRLTAAGAEALKAAPHLLHPGFLAAFAELDDAERGQLAGALHRIERLMTTAAPDVGPPRPEADERPETVRT
ncbi:MAG: MarR family winged helix-turn-helix transcriptional regulator [Brevundimonas sp.]|uniref:MarR family winged helix-turn-helix transcriptional regulator n=1 Tax=Brevundimonas sp. TaxID=1871086 RepID=UPI00391BCEA6